MKKYNNAFRKGFLATCFVVCCLSVKAVEWQWTTKIQNIVSTETQKNPTAFLWIPASCHQLKAVVISTHNMCEETLFENSVFRKRMEELNMGIIWITPGWDQKWDVGMGSQKAFDQMLADFADKSGYTELINIPIVPFGHSAMATFPWNYGAWNPEKTLAIISYHGDAPQTYLTGYGRDNMEWGKRNIDGIPGLMIEGEYEWWEERVNPALGFRMKYPKSCISFLCDAGRGHFDVSDKTAAYIALFIEKSLETRLPEIPDFGQAVTLKKLDPKAGWLAQRWHPNQRKRSKPDSYLSYKGNEHDAFWYFDKEMAQITEERYQQTMGKKDQYLGIVQNGKLVKYDPNHHARMVIDFIPGEDGLTFCLKPVFTDSTRMAYSNYHASEAPKIEKISGPVEIINDTTFSLRFYYMGMDNPRRSNSIWLVATQPGDKSYKETVQQFTIQAPFRNTEGKQQYILFPGIPSIDRSMKEIVLNAVSDCGLPVYYYVKEGPAEITGNTLRLTQIPPRSKFPIKVTVVAWQYGLKGKIQTAEPVERSFYINQ